MTPVTKEEKISIIEKLKNDYNSDLVDFLDYNRFVVRKNYQVKALTGEIVRLYENRLFDEKCKEIILSNKYNNISPFTLEVAVVSTVDNISIKDKSFTSATKYGLIDINGKELLPCIYDSIHPHWDGFTEIIKDGVKKATSIVRIIDGRFIWDKAVKWPR